MRLLLGARLTLRELVSFGRPLREALTEPRLAALHGVPILVREIDSRSVALH